MGLTHLGVIDRCMESGCNVSTEKEPHLLIYNKTFIIYITLGDRHCNAVTVTNETIERHRKAYYNSSNISCCLSTTL
jgi:hypothetical protein